MESAVRSIVRLLPPAARWFMRGERLYKVCQFVNGAVRGEGMIRIASGPPAGSLFSGGDTAGYVLGASEPAVLKQLVERLRAGSVFYDVGANIGFMSLLGSKLVGDTGVVIAFESLEDADPKRVRRQAHRVADAAYRAPGDLPASKRWRRERSSAAAADLTSTIQITDRNRRPYLAYTRDGFIGREIFLTRSFEVDRIDAGERIPIKRGITIDHTSTSAQTSVQARLSGSRGSRRYRPRLRAGTQQRKAPPLQPRRERPPRPRERRRDRAQR